MMLNKKMKAKVRSIDEDIDFFDSVLQKDRLAPFCLCSV